MDRSIPDHVGCDPADAFDRGGIADLCRDPFCSTEKLSGGFVVLQFKCPLCSTLEVHQRAGKVLGSVGVCGQALEVLLRAAV